MAGTRKKDGPVMGRPNSLEGPVGELARALGGTPALAEEFSVHEATVRRWAQFGCVKNATIKEKLARLFKKHGIVDGVEAFMRSSGPIKRGGIHPGLKLGTGRTI